MKKNFFFILYAETLFMDQHCKDFGSYVEAADYAMSLLDDANDSFVSSVRFVQCEDGVAVGRYYTVSKSWDNDLTR